MAICNALGWITIDYHATHAMRTFVPVTVLIVIGYWVLWHYFQGKNWARILVLLTSLLAVFNLRYWNPGSPNLLKSPTRVMLLGESVLAIFLLIWLNTPAVRSFFKRRTA
jgi:phosphatidylserine synthase